MASRFTVRWLPLLGLVGCLALAAEVRAQNNKGPHPDKKAQEEALKKAKEAALQKAKEAARQKAQQAALQKAQQAALQKAREAAGQEMIFQEAHHLRQAIILLDKADHDYDGHRVRAIAKAKEAEKVLSDHVMKHGTAQQKEATVLERKAVAAADEENRRSSTHHERQKKSDQQLHEARELLHKARAVLAEHKQEEPLRHVHQAIKQIDVALEVN